MKKRTCKNFSQWAKNITQISVKSSITATDAMNLSLQISEIMRKCPIKISPPQKRTFFQKVKDFILSLFFRKEKTE